MVQWSIKVPEATGKKRFGGEIKLIKSIQRPLGVSAEGKLRDRNAIERWLECSKPWNEFSIFASLARALYLWFYAIFIAILSSCALQF
jgi:hypothetical protein